jgi:hypothetical protein
MPGPVLFCYDGSQGSRAAMTAAAELLAHPVPAVVLTIWQPASVLLGSVSHVALAHAGRPVLIAPER